MRAGAGCKITAPGQKLHGSVVYFFISSLRTLDGLSALGERRRVKDYEIKRLFALRFKLGEQIENIGNNKIKLFGTIIQENINSSMWNYGAALSFFMLIIIGLTTFLSGSDKEVEGGTV